MIRRLISPSSLKPYYYYSSFSFSNIAVADYLVKRHQFSLDSASKVSLRLNKDLNETTTDSLLSFLKQSGFTRTHTESVIKRMPNLLALNLETSIKPVFQVFTDLGFSPDDVAEIITADPWILTRSPNKRIRPSILFLNKLLGSNVTVARLLKQCGGFLKQDLEKTMQPNIEFLQTSMGMGYFGLDPMPIIRGNVCNFPRLFLWKTDYIKGLVARLDDINFYRHSDMFIHAIHILGFITLEKWELKLKAFRSLGLSTTQIKYMFYYNPLMFVFSEYKLKERVKIYSSFYPGEIEIE